MITNMKTHLNSLIKPYALVGIVGLVVLSGCDKFVTKYPIDQTSVENSFTTAEDANMAVLGIYQRLDGAYAQNMARLTEVITDNAYSQQDVLKGAGAVDLRELAEFRLTSENSFMQNRWNDLYNGISRANLVLERIVDITFSDQQQKNQYIGESKFLRALFYFDLVRFFGGVPVTLSPIMSSEEAYALARESEEYVYTEVIVKDLEEAAQLLPVSYGSNQLGRVTKGAAEALLAKVYLTVDKPELALPLLEKVRASATYRLMDEYAQVFDSDNTPESIFEIQYTADEAAVGNPYPNWFLPNDASSGKDVFGNGFLGGAGGGHAIPTSELYESYERTDQRRDYTFAPYVSALEGGEIQRVNKYRDAPASPNNSEDNLIVLRYADVLLMLAEAINEASGGPTDEAYEAVDEVRRRAGVNPWDRNLAYEGFKDQLLAERRRELAFENHRWFDLKRFGKAIEILSAKGYNIQAHHLLFPIPRIEVELNQYIDQNPGY